MLPRKEQETYINFSPIERVASIYTSQPVVWQRLEKIAGFKLVEEGRQRGNVISKEFEFPRSFVRLTKTGLKIGPPRAVSAKFREESSARLQERVKKC